MNYHASEMRRYIRTGLTLLVMMLFTTNGRADGFVHREELQQKEQWVKERLLEFKLTPTTPQSQRPETGLVVLANHGVVQANARAGQPLKIGDAQYTRGLYCHAVSRLMVRLPGPGQKFTAIAGVDSNTDTSGGRGSVVFAVTIGDKVAFKSDVMRENTPARQVAVDLGGAKEFVLDIGDAGDGISCDQADWADAKILLADGRELWLGDLPLLDDAWTLPARSSQLPFAFLYGGQPSDSLLANWPRKVDARQLDPQRTEHTLTWIDPQTGLEVRCVAVEYADFPAIEWTVYFRNAGQVKTPILESILAIDTRLERAVAGEFVLRGIRGDSCTPDSYQPYAQTLEPGVSHRFAPVGGRPTNGSFPYYNLAMPGGGLLVAVGWPGQWATAFTRDAERGLRITAGQQRTHLALKPGEEIRTPLVALLFWQEADSRGPGLPQQREGAALAEPLAGPGSAGASPSRIGVPSTSQHAAMRAQNLWRRWMIAHNLPRTGGRPPAPIYTFCSGGFFPGLKVSEASERQFIDVLTKERIKPDYWWMDAGWYPCGEWPEVGTWEPDPQRFPAGLKGVSDYVHALGTKLIVWFEPERVTGGSWLAKHHPDWLLGGTLLNLGNPDARQWLTGHVDRLIRTQGIDLYRQDFNMDPLGFWEANDAPDRQGVTENLHVQGYLAYWDELRRRNPELRIDSCASGGRRNDLETLRRAVPLLRSDYQSFQGDPGFAVGNQGHTYGLSSWIPYYGQGVYFNPQQFVYSVRSHMCPAFAIVMDLRKGDCDWDLYRRLVSQWRQVADCFLGDYYPLTPYSLAEEDWIAWQFHRAEQGHGLVQAFRRAKNGEPTKVLHLSGLDPNAHYAVTDLDVGQPQTLTGQELMGQGLPVQISDQPGAALLTYRKAD